MRSIMDTPGVTSIVFSKGKALCLLELPGSDTKIPAALLNQTNVRVKLQHDNLITQFEMCQGLQHNICRTRLHVCAFLWRATVPRPIRQKDKTIPVPPGPTIPREWGGHRLGYRPCVCIRKASQRCSLANPIKLRYLGTFSPNASVQLWITH